jgi:Protein-tyrosine phosphatase
MSRWELGQHGVMGLPSGRVLRGRGLRGALPAGPEPEFGFYLQATPPPSTVWPARWVRWRDWWLPADTDDVRDALIEVWQLALTQRVEVACSGGRGRTGTAFACLAIRDGVAPADAVS